MGTREERLLAQQKNDIQNVMGTENGRRFMWRLLAYCGIYKDIEGDDPAAMSKQIGKRNVGLYLLGIISDIDEEAVFTMMREASNVDKQEKFELEQEDQKRQELAKDEINELL